MSDYTSSRRQTTYTFFVCPPPSAESMEEQLKREIAISKKMNHPNIVQMREVFKTRNHINIVLEFVTGGELFDRIGCSFFFFMVLLSDDNLQNSEQEETKSIPRNPVSIHIASFTLNMCKNMFLLNFDLVLIRF